MFFQKSIGIGTPISRALNYRYILFRENTC